MSDLLRHEMTDRQLSSVSFTYETTVGLVLCQRKSWCIVNVCEDVWEMTETTHRWTEKKFFSQTVPEFQTEVSLFVLERTRFKELFSIFEMLMLLYMLKTNMVFSDWSCAVSLCCDWPAECRVKVQRTSAVRGGHVSQVWPADRQVRTWSLVINHTAAAQGCNSVKSELRNNHTF